MIRSGFRCATNSETPGSCWRPGAPLLVASAILVPHHREITPTPHSTTPSPRTGTWPAEFSCRGRGATRAGSEPSLDPNRDFVHVGAIGCSWQIPLYLRTI